MKQTLVVGDPEEVVIRVSGLETLIACRCPPRATSNYFVAPLQPPQACHHLAVTCKKDRRIKDYRTGLRELGIRNREGVKLS